VTVAKRRTRTLAKADKATTAVAAGATVFTPDQVAAIAQAVAGQASATAPVTALPRQPGLLALPFGPGVPLTPAAINPPRPDSGRPEPRAYEYAVTSNLPGVGDKLVPWQVLRQAADGVTIFRKCIEIRKDEFSSLEWDVVVSKKAIGRELRTAGGTPRAELEQQMQARLAPDIARLTDWWMEPDRRNGLSWIEWIKKALEERFVLDALAIYPRHTYGGDLYSFEILDGSTIKPLLDADGGRPMPPSAAYQQILWGFPRGEFVADLGEDGLPDGVYASDQLIYEVDNVRSFTPYGYSATERALTDGALYVQRNAWMLATYTDGVMPSGWLKAGDGQAQWTPDQLSEYERQLNDYYAGITAARQRLRILPYGMEPVETASEAEKYKPDYDLYLLKLCCGHFQTTIAELGFTEPGGLGSTGYHEGQADVQDRKATRPTVAAVEALLNKLSRRHLGMPAELEIRFAGDEHEDQAAEDEIADRQIKGGRTTLNEDRDRRGLARFNFAEADKPFIVGGTGGITFIEGAEERAAAAAEQAQMLADAKSNPPADEDGPPSKGGEGSKKPNGGPGGGLNKADGDGEDAELVKAELDAYTRWARKNPTPKRPFQFRYATPDHLTDPDPLRAEFDGWVFIADGAILSKADFVAWNAAHPTHPRGPNGKFVKVGSVMHEAALRIARELGAPDVNDERAKRIADLERERDNLAAEGAPFNSSEGARNRYSQISTELQRLSDPDEPVYATQAPVFGPGTRQAPEAKPKREPRPKPAPAATPQSEPEPEPDHEIGGDVDLGPALPSDPDVIDIGQMRREVQAQYGREERNWPPEVRAHMREMERRNNERSMVAIAEGMKPGEERDAFVRGSQAVYDMERTGERVGDFLEAVAAERRADEERAARDPEFKAWLDEHKIRGLALLAGEEVGPERPRPPEPDVVEGDVVEAAPAGTLAITARESRAAARAERQATRSAAKPPPAPSAAQAEYDSAVAELEAIDAEIQELRDNGNRHGLGPFPQQRARRQEAALRVIRAQNALSEPPAEGELPVRETTIPVGRGRRAKLADAGRTTPAAADVVEGSIVEPPKTLRPDFSVDPDTVREQLLASTSREEASALIDRLGLKAPELRRLAKDMGVPVKANETKARTRDTIVALTAGRRLDSAAILTSRAGAVDRAATRAPSGVTVEQAQRELDEARRAFDEGRGKRTVRMNYLDSQRAQTVREKEAQLAAAQRRLSETPRPPKPQAAPQAPQEPGRHPVTPEGVATAIRELNPADAEWVSITDLRGKLGGTRAEQDAILHDLAVSRKVQVIPEENQKTLTEADREAAIEIGGEPKHVIRVPRDSSLRSPAPVHRPSAQAVVHSEPTGEPTAAEKRAAARAERLAARSGPPRDAKGRRTDLPSSTDPGLTPAQREILQDLEGRQADADFEAAMAPPGPPRDTTTQLVREQLDRFQTREEAEAYLNGLNLTRAQLAEIVSAQGKKPGSSSKKQLIGLATGGARLRAYQRAVDETMAERTDISSREERRLAESAESVRQALAFIDGKIEDAEIEAEGHRASLAAARGRAQRTAAQKELAAAEAEAARLRSRRAVVAEPPKPDFKAQQAELQAAIDADTRAHIDADTAEHERLLAEAEHLDTQLNFAESEEERAQLAAHRDRLGNQMAAINRRIEVARRGLRKADEPDPKALPPDQRWPAWAVDTAIAAAYAAQIQAAMAGGLTTLAAARSLAERWLAAAAATPGLGAATWLEAEGFDITPELTVVLDDLYAEAAFAGRKSAAAAIATPPRLAVSLEVDWDDWTPGDPDAARLLLNADALQALLDRFGITIRTVGLHRLDELAGILADGLEAGDGPDELARKIRHLTTNSAQAYRIAATETARALSAAAVAEYADADIATKGWLNANDQRVCPICKANEDAGDIPLDAAFPSGEPFPPAHPLCRCAIVPGVEEL